MRRLRVLAVVSSVALSLLAPPAPADTELRLDKQREAFASAYREVRAGRVDTVSRYRSELDDYVLFPYLEYETLRRHFHRRDAGDIEAFLAREQGTVLEARLRTAWLRHLARRRDWPQYVRAYRPQDSSELACRYLAARLETTGIDARLLADTRDIWLTGKSLPDACDPPFAALYDSSLMSDELLWRRIALAMDARRPALARYLGRKLKDPENIELLAIWQQLYQRPSGLKPGRIPEDTPRGRHIVSHVLERRARQNLDAAIALWPTLTAHYHFTEPERSKTVRALALRAARQDHPEAMALLDAVGSDEVDKAVERARLATALAHEAWDALARWTAEPSRHPGHALMWRYWRARALDEAGHPEAARALYEALAAERDYYGYLAADQIGAPYRFVHVPVAASESERAALAARPGVARMVELLETGYEREARREWWHALALLERRELEVVAELIAERGHHHRAIMTLGRARSYDDLDIRFPLLFQSTVEQYGAKRDLDPAVIYAIIRAESAFLADARSPAGARGLMQLMPTTAVETARRIGLRYRGPSDLARPRINIMLGTAYLKRMLDRYEGHFAMAAAAYNAGPHRVARWRDSARCTPLDIWVELVPFAETRSYIRRTLFYSRIYQRRLGRDVERLSERYAAIPPAGGSNMTC